MILIYIGTVIFEFLKPFENLDRSERLRNSKVHKDNAFLYKHAIWRIVLNTYNTTTYAPLPIVVLPSILMFKKRWSAMFVFFKQFLMHIIFCRFSCV